MTHVLRIKLPVEIVDHIKLYTGEGVWRNGKYINIHRIPKDDWRRELLIKRPMIKQVHNGTFSHPLRGLAWFKLSSGKFMIITSKYSHEWIGGANYYNGFIWEMQYKDEKTIKYII